MTPKLTQSQAEELLSQLKGWELDQNNHLQKQWKFRGSITPKKFVDTIWEIANSREVSHHPNISFTYGFVEVTIWTHAINGLSNNDFILAAKIDTITI